MELLENRKRMHALADDTVTYYENNPRSFTYRGMHMSKVCAYNGKDGAHCAVGRHFLPPIKEDGEHLMWNTQTVDWLHDAIQGEDISFWEIDDVRSLDDFLCEDVRGFSISYWKALQRLHDEDRFWDEEWRFGASGLAYLSNLHDRVNKGEFDQTNEEIPT